ncbi:hypothetical protein [Plantactinospora endophytica]|uniref:Uncharacterized protein n=1 Tax=Plantactinospora endophytica TaxID=673535 RepID=A0ABQ4EBE5_9ACTN|nr:hypothetical protein [Plantactinospora endophytica]GIG92062.1 hypothetical protein Pen02_69980 [Plantactinospora endophytica]
MDAGGIDDYLGQIERGLTGARPRWRSQVLDELRYGLEDAADRHRSLGGSRIEAERLAVTEWGPAAVVVRDFAYESLHSGGRRLSVAVLATAPVAVAAWSLTLLSGPPDPWPSDVPIEIELAGRMMTLLALGAVCAAVGVLLGGRRARGVTWRRGSLLGYRAGLAAGGALATSLALALLILLERAVVDPGSVGWPGSVLAAGVSVGVLVLLAGEVRPLVRAGRLTAGALPGERTPGRARTSDGTGDRPQ